jgi:hypothetical protein
LALLDLIQRQLDDNTVSQLSQELGTDPNTTRQAVPAALTALLGGLSQNAQQPGGAQQLDSALAAHDGSILDNLGGLFGSSLGAQGAGILGHIFGNHQPAVASQIGQKTGLNTAQAGQLLMLLAPLVLGYLSRARQQQGNAGNAGNAAAPGSGGITDILNGERTHIEQAHPEHRGILNWILDRNHDGKILDDVTSMAGGLLGGGR